MIPRISFIHGMVMMAILFGVAGAAHADTYLVIANNTDDTAHINTSYPVASKSARWTPLDATLDAGGFTFNLRDTHQKCNDGGWRIQADVTKEGAAVGSHEYCIQLGFAEVGCLAVRLDPGGKIAMNKAHGFHCSNQWWSDRDGPAVFKTIMEAAGAVAGARGGGTPAP
ncbi:hypothetical protein ACLESD_29165 [Pyxidicoccus sp. 3LFB2]